MLSRLADACWSASLFTLPWVGVGLLRLVTGRDWGGGLQPSWVLMTAALLLLMLSGRGLPPMRELPGRPLWILLGVWYATVLLSGAGLILAPGPVDPGAAWLRFGKQVVQLGIMLGFTVGAFVWGRRADGLRNAAGWIVAGALFQAGYGVLQAVVYGSDPGWFRVLESVFTSNPSILSGSRDLYVGNAMLAVPRLRGTMCEPLYLGDFLLLAVPLVAVTGWSRWRRLLVQVVLLMLLAATWSRGAWLAGLTALGVWGWVALRRGWRPSGRFWFAGVLGLAVVLAPVAWLAGDPGLLARRMLQSFSLVDWSNLTRIYSMQAAWRAFLLSPVVGVGWGQFAWHYPALADPMGLQSQFTWPVVNNFPLQILCETGLLGLGAAGAFLWRVGARWRSALASAAAAGVPVDALAAVTAAAVGIGLQLLTFSQYNLPHIWVTLGLLMAVVADGEEDHGSP